MVTGMTNQFLVEGAVRSLALLSTVTEKKDMLYREETIRDWN